MFAFGVSSAKFSQIQPNVDRQEETVTAGRIRNLEDSDKNSSRPQTTNTPPQRHHFAGEKGMYTYQRTTRRATEHETRNRQNGYRLPVLQIPVE